MDAHGCSIIGSAILHVLLQEELSSSSSIKKKKNHDHDHHWKRKEILRRVKSRIPHANKKEIKKTLKQLEKSGQIARVPGTKKKVYTRRIITTVTANTATATTSAIQNPAKPNSTKRGAVGDNVKVTNGGADDAAAASISEDNKPLPIAQVLRKRRNRSGVLSDETPVKDDNNSSSSVVVDDIDEEIRRLEEELNKDDTDDDDTDDDDSDSEDEDNGDENYGSTSSSAIMLGAETTTTSTIPTTTIKQQPGVISLSSLATDRIAALPPTCLPQCKSRTLKGIDATNDVSSLSKQQQPQEPKAKRRRKEGKKSAADESSSRSIISDGLRAAVQQVLEGYVPRSNEKLPFYCRVCAQQYPNAEEFVSHKKTEFHKAAVQMEQKASYCKLCQKQLTSPVQLKEHVLSKPHRERLLMLQQRQQRQPQQAA